MDMGLGLVLLEARVDNWVLGGWFGVVCPCVRLSWIGCLLVGSKGWLNAGVMAILMNPPQLILHTLNDGARLVDCRSLRTSVGVST